MDVKIKDIQITQEFDENLKLPASTGGNAPASVTLGQIRQKIQEPIENRLVEVEHIAEEAKELTDDVKEISEAVFELNKKKANTDGYYTELTSGMAEQLLSPDGITDEEPYIYRTSAGSTSISTGVAEIKSLDGNSIVWNQQAQVAEIYIAGYNVTRNGLTLTILANNKFKVVGTSTGITNFNFTNYNINLIKNHKYILLPKYGESNYGLFVNGKHTNYIGLFECSFDDEISRHIELRINANTTVDITLDFPQLFDLTQMFGAGNEPTIEEFKSLFPLDYYNYNAGEIINVNVEGLKTVGFNQWDEEWENGSIMSSTGKKITSQDTIRSKNYIPVFPNTKYYFNYPVKGENKTVISVHCYDENHNWIGMWNAQTGNWTIAGGGFYFNVREIQIPSNGKYLLFTLPVTYGTTYNNDICINLSWSGYRNGDYEPYVEHNINIPVKEIKDANGNLLFPDGLLSAGTVKDEVTSDKAVKRIGVVDLGSLEWMCNTNDNTFYNPTKYIPIANNSYNIVCAKYKTAIGMFNIQFDKAIGNGQDARNGRLFVRDDSFNKDVAAFKTAMQGVMLYYELATPIEVDFKEVPQVFGEKLNLTYFVDDFGTEEFTTTEPTAPVKHSTFYMTNLRDKIRNIDGNTDSGALMNGSVDNLLTTLGGALGGTLTKTWDVTNKRWTFAFTPNATNLNEEGGEQ